MGNAYVIKTQTAPRGKKRKRRICAGFVEYAAKACGAAICSFCAYACAFPCAEYI